MSRQKILIVPEGRIDEMTALARHLADDLQRLGGDVEDLLNNDDPREPQTAADGFYGAAAMVRSLYLFLKELRVRPDLGLGENALQQIDQAIFEAADERNEWSATSARCRRGVRQQTEAVIATIADIIAGQEPERRRTSHDQSSSTVTNGRR
jgi:hypothetical protein